MRKLRVRCRTCDDVVVSVAEIVLTSSAPDPCSYAFRCPLCRSFIEHDCTESIARLLLLNGAGTRLGLTTARAAGQPDLEVWHLDELRRLLERPDWLNLLRNAGA